MRSPLPLVKSVLEDGGFDTTEAKVLDWLDQRHKLMCARSDCYRRKVPLGPTVAGQQSYPIPAEVQEIREVLVVTPTSSGVGVPYGAGRHSDLAQGALGYIWLGGIYLRAGGGIYTRDENAEGQDLLALYPIPSEAGLTISVLAVCRPEVLQLSPSGLVAGGTATIRYCLTTRELTPTELATFVGGGGLPVGVGTEAGVASTVLEYQLPGKAWATAAVVKDATGAYHSLVTAPEQGTIYWRAKWLDAGGAIVAQTPLGEEPVKGGGGLRTPPEYDDALVAGAIATGLERLEGRADLAGTGEQKFAAACQELKGEVNRRFRRPGGAEIRVGGLNG